MFKKRQLVYLSIAVLLLFSNISFSINPKEPVKKKRPKIGLVLSGGGAKGFAYIGMLRVFQEVGLPVDYIGGTSIGSIMGGLYAIGYSPDEIQKMIDKQNWEALLRDEIPRKYIAYAEKEFLENSIVSLPIKKKKIGLKRSMYKGQQINLLLNRYFSPAWNVTDFSKLQTPFLCVGTNLYNGDAEVMTTGYLPMAIRASMSIPGYFSPTHYNGKYLVDGGIVNNYPALPVKKSGAQFLIGGDVQSGLKDDISKLTSLTEIINQIIFFHAEEANRDADSLININIRFNVPAGMMDFTKYDTIIAYGERLARTHYDELKALADSLNTIEKVTIKPHLTVPLDSIYISNVVYNGNEDMSTIYLNNYFEKFKNSKVAYDDLEEVITTVYGTRFFKYIFYELEPVDGGRKADLILNMEEASPGYISASIHYDFDYHGSIRVNGIFRNVFGNRSKLFGELIMGTNPRFRTLYMISNGAKPGFGLEIDMYDFTFDYYEGRKKVNRVSVNNLKVSTFVTSTFNNLYSFRAGFEYEYFKFKQKIDINPDFTPYENFNSYGNLFVKFRADTRDKPYFATSGFDAEFKMLYAMTFSKGWVDTAFSNSAVMYLKINNNISLSPKVTIKPGLFAGWTFKQKEPPIQHWFGTGGLNEINYVSSFVPFTGVDFVQKLGLYSAIARLKLQYNVYGKLYVTLRSDFGATEESIQDITKPENTMFGYGITTSYNSFIGPVEFTVMGSNLNSSVSFFINVGFSF
jgi:NTE family protein